MDALNKIKAWAIAWVLVSFSALTIWVLLSNGNLEKEHQAKIVSFEATREQLRAVEMFTVSVMNSLASSIVTNDSSQLKMVDYQPILNFNEAIEEENKEFEFYRFKKKLLDEVARFNIFYEEAFHQIEDRNDQPSERKLNIRSINKLQASSVKIFSRINEANLKIESSLLTENATYHESLNTNILIAIVCSLINVFLTLGIILYYSQKGLISFDKVRESVADLSFGKPLQLRKSDFQLIDIGLYEDLNKIYSHLNSSKEYIEKLSIGNFSEDIDKLLDDNNQTDQTLIKLREILSAGAKESEDRAWVADGLASMNTLIRDNQNDLQMLCDKVLTSIVKYIKANQGSVYFVDDEPEILIRLISSYAWSKKKHIEQSFYPGENVIGQVFLERETLVLKEIPKNFIRITSGLGDASPNSVLLVPIKRQDKVLGIIELASFGHFRSITVDFVERVADALAAAFLSIKTTSHTQKLLTESTQLAQKLKEGEEELLQNMEELKSTTEEMERRQTELSKLNHRLKSSEAVLLKEISNVKSLKLENANLKAELQKLKIVA